MSGAAIEAAIILRLKRRRNQNRDEFGWSLGHNKQLQFEFDPTFHW